MEIGIAVVLVIVMAVGFWILNRKQRHELEEAEREKVTLSKSLESVTKSNENALRLIHLFKLSLRGTTVLLLSERDRATRLIKKYRKLHQKFQTTVTEYKEFREEVERKAKQRLARTGVGALLSVIPGIGFLQLVGDLIELVDFVNEVSEDANLSDAIELFKLSHDAIESLANFAVLSTIPLLLSEMPSDEDSTEIPGALTRDYQSIVKETFEANLGPDIETPDISALNAFVKDMIQHLKDVVESVPESERRNEIAKIVNDFWQFGIASYDAGEAPKALVDGSSPGSKS